MTEDSYWTDPVLLAAQHDWSDDDSDVDIEIEDISDTPPKSENSRSTAHPVV
jgi:hypothetical protein